MNTFSKILLSLLALAAFVSCKKSESSGTQSSVAQITAFAFTANDDYPGLGEAVFVVEQRTDTGLIRMREHDSVRYGTPLTAIVPKITYYTTPSSVTFYIGDQVVALTGYDTLDLSGKPIRIRVVAQNTEYEKWYNLRFERHQVDGDLFHWQQVTSRIPNAYTQGEQKAFLHKGDFYYYQNDGSGVRLFTSEGKGDSWTWSSPMCIDSLPKDCDVWQIIEGDLYFFYGKGNHFYYSSDGKAWKHIRTDLDIVALYMCMAIRNENDPIRLWLSARDPSDHLLRLYTVGKDLVPKVASGIGLPGDLLPSDFPIEDFATIPFQSSSLHEHALIAGGYDSEHRITAARWSLEYNYSYQTYRLTNLGYGDASIASFAGSSCSYYGTYLYLLGGINKEGKYLKNVYSSVDEGVHWVEVTDTVNRKRPEEFKGRYHASSMVQEVTPQEHYIYIIGGRDASTTYSDVYRGRSNSVDWPEIGN